MMIGPREVLAIVKEHGPILPAQISEHISADTMLIGALLSDLIKEKHVLYTHAKWGGSPLYYVDSQIEKIQKIYEKLNEKDKRAFDLIKKEQIVAEDEQTPLMRTCLKQIKDFAIPLRIKTPAGERLFWKWYLTTNETALSILKQKLAPKIVSKPVEEKSESKPEQQYTNETGDVPSSKETQKVMERLDAQQQAEQEQFRQQQSSTIEKQQKKGSLLAVSDDFFDEIEEKLRQKGVEIIHADVVRKNAELDLHIRINTPLGAMKMYAKVKQKKKSNDADISQAFVQATLQKLPGCYIHTGELTKKAQDLLDSDFKSMLVVQV